MFLFVCQMCLDIGFPNSKTLFTRSRSLICDSLARSQSVILILIKVKFQTVDNLWITFFDMGYALAYTYNNYMENIFITKLVKIGTSKGIVIPVNILRAYNWQRGDTLIFGFSGGDQLSIKRLSDRDFEYLKSNSLPDIN